MFVFTSLLLAVLFGTQGEAAPCKGSCVATWTKCAGKGLSTQRPCCSQTDVCVYKDPTYSQCRPKSNPLPSNWPDAKRVKCDDPEACDVNSLTPLMVWGLAEIDAWDLLLEWVPYYFDDRFETCEGRDCCAQICLDNKDCYVYEETVDGDCYLYPKEVIGKGLRIRPWFDAEIMFMRCFKPDPLCDPATRQVREVNPKGPFYKLTDTDRDRVYFSKEDAAIAFESCITICKMASEAGPCTGFLLETYTDGAKLCVPLYEYGPKVTKYVASKNPKLSSAYSIAKC